MIALSHYQITRKLSETGYSLVYRGYRSTDRLPVVLKLLKDPYPSPESVARLQWEYKMLRQLQVEGMIHAHDLEWDRQHLVMVLEDFGGDSLTLLGLAGCLELGSFLTLALAITEIVSRLHSARVIHKDLNPSNILLNPQTGQVKLIDFGLSTFLSQEKLPFRPVEYLEGTLAYIAPEQTGRMNRVLDYRSDLYSLGATFYELLTAYPPFPQEDPLELIHSHIARQPHSPRHIRPEIPEVLANLVLKLLSKNAEDRYQSAQGVYRDLFQCYKLYQAQGQIPVFSLAQEDAPLRLILPQQLYGREAELASLQACFAAVRQGQRQLVLITGYSGVGKTALVNELHRPLTADRGWFIAGKYEQYKRDIPYFALAQAFDDLCGQWLTASEDWLNQWKQTLIQGLGNNGQVLIDIIPRLELVLGPQPPLASVGNREAQNRFMLQFQRFLTAIGQLGHPLILFLDDLQWADSASLDLIFTLLDDPDIHFLLVIGAYRDNEIDLLHPLTHSLAALDQTTIPVERIQVGNLSAVTVNAWIADTLHVSPADCYPLVEQVMQKTAGNAFFTAEFLKSLYSEQLLTYNFTNRHWEWDLQQIEAKGITDNVIELMADKIANLPQVTQQILKLAACIGNVFELRALGAIAQQTTEDLLHHLQPALLEGLISPAQDHFTLLATAASAFAAKVYLKFLHDRIQQAAYSLLPPQERAECHRQIGLQLLASLSESEREEQVFDLVSHLNAGVACLVHPQERLQAAELNLRAGQQALAQTAYASALKYLRIGLDLLPDQGWQTHNSLAWDLHLHTLEAEYLNTHFQAAEAMVETLLQRSHTPLEQARVYEIRILSFIAQNRMQESLDIGFQALQMLGIELVEQPPVLPEIATLVQLPRLEDPEKAAALKLLVYLHAPAYIAVPELLPKLVFTTVDLCYRFGNSPLSAFGYAYFGLLQCGVFSEIEQGYALGQLAQQLLDHYEPRDIRCKVEVLLNACIRHWREHAVLSTQGLQQAITTGLDTGDLEYASTAVATWHANIFLVSEPLTSIHQQQQHYKSLLHSLRQDFYLNYCRIWEQVTLNLQGQSEDPVRLIGEAFDERSMIPHLEQTNNYTSLYVVHLVRAMLAFGFQEFSLAWDCLQQAEPYRLSVSGLLISTQYPFLQSLLILQLLPDWPQSSHAGHLERVEANQKQIKCWAEHAPMNFQHKWKLVEAEKHRYQGEIFAAMQAYEQAIQGAREHGYLQDEALAYELAAHFYLGQGFDEIAQTYFAQALYRYERWQAGAKVRELDRRFPMLRPSIQPRESHNTSRTTSDVSPLSELDFKSALKASQALAGEILLDRLLTRLVQILLENAGAEIAILLLENHGQLWIEAQGSLQENSIQVMQQQPTTDHLPLSVLNYVHRSQTSVVLDHACQEGRFTQDKYIQQHQSQSILCAPLIHQGQFGGIIYLENDLTTSAFTQDRLELLQLLSSQAAIAIANARLYAEVKESENRLTQFLEAMPVGIAVLDANGNPYYGNQRAAELLGQPFIHEPLFSKQAEIFQVYRSGEEQLYPMAEMPIFRALQGEKTAVDDMELRHAEKTIPLEIWGAPIYDQQGKIAFGMAAFQDITQRKLSEKILAEYNRTLENQVLDRTQELRRTLEELQATQKELIHSEKMAALGQLVASIAHEINTPLGAIRASIGNITTAMNRTLVQMPPLLQSLSPERQTDFLEIIQAMRDRPQTTLSSREERQLRGHLTQLLEKAELDSPDHLASIFVEIGLTQEIQIQTFMPLLQDPDHELMLACIRDLASQLRNSENIHLAIERVSKIVFALRSYAHQSSQGEKIMANVVEGIEIVLTIYQNLLKQGISIIRHYDLELPEIWCFPDELNQVWTNLIHNAIQAMQGVGQLQIKAARVNNHIQVQITDTGSGIAQEILPRIFDPFFTTKPSGEGSGLGLDIVRRIIDKHQGSILVASQPGRTTFTVNLPIGKPAVGLSA
ncbi:MAG: AAA family ATPase [Synechococcaceae cyanobacterium SM2_3_1]|nr:AAA family ATPase [Synechococcaceae cyanobacterium SM2_3_1]